MEIYNNEDEQLDAVRSFFRENGKAIVVGVVLGIGALFGWRYWQSHQKQEAANTSMYFDQAMVHRDNTSNLDAFIKANENTYGIFAALKLAQESVDKGDFAKAKQQLLWAQGHTKDDNLLPTISLRLARVQLQEKQFDDALKTLDTVQKGGWFAQAQAIRGDVLAEKGDTKGAREAYSQASESDPSPVLKELLRIKLNNLAA
ncbi:YfgM family protein [Budvicia diplopodorum]|uniref:YfgM family protein n=1 Tax=Budvicia diplopodorum TaxID=1119056 RepID=UPI00135A10AC|nr:YfgM family protein [Budvicia diplopodorum]